jgi:hypothetical protein
VTPPVLPRGGIPATGVRAYIWSVLPLVVGVLVFAPSLFAASAEVHRMAATIGHPAVVPVTDRGRRDNASPPRIIITISAFTPATDGSAVGIVVRTKSGYCGSGREIGRFSIYPNEPFAAYDSRHVKSFGLDLPPDAFGRVLRSVTVSIEPARGKGVGARVAVAGARIE